MKPEHELKLPTTLQEFIHKSRYARFRDELGRRESWEETVARYIDFFGAKYPGITEKLQDAKEGILSLEVMPSMRAVMTAGKALERDNVAGYNCSYIAVDSPRAFDEACYILMCGTGVGFSVERQYINKLPLVAEQFEKTDTTIVVKDSKKGWAQGLKELISLLYQGQLPRWDLSKIRPAGERLKTFGGRASGPAPLESLFNFTSEVFQNAAGRRLTSLECHDLMCKIGDIVVCGGVRRSALISLSNLTDERMRGAKTGQWWLEHPQRALANNSVAYTETPEVGIFLKEWLSLVESKNGERGIFNRKAAEVAVERTGRRDVIADFGTNPCSEIILRPNQFCNLSEVVVRKEDTLQELHRKVELAAFLGTIQATLTHFPYLRKEWETNTKEEALLGVSLTGIMDHPVLNGTEVTPEKLASILNDLRTTAVEANKQWAEILGINPAVAVTCIKPSGTVSQLVDSASGIHSRYSSYYIRTVRADKKDPIAAFLIDSGVPYEDDVYKPEYNYVFSFPVKAPDTAITKDYYNAIEQLELWRLYAENWCEHKPSMTVYVKEHEWPAVGAWVWNHFDKISGVSFLPHTEHTYQQAPYQEITKEEYAKLVNDMPSELNWELLKNYEETDNTTASQELACTGGSCEVI